MSKRTTVLKLLLPAALVSMTTNVSAVGVPLRTNHATIHDLQDGTNTRKLSGYVRRENLRYFAPKIVFVNLKA